MIEAVAISVVLLLVAGVVFAARRASTRRNAANASEVYPLW